MVALTMAQVRAFQRLLKGHKRTTLPARSSRRLSRLRLIVVTPVSRRRSSTLWMRTVRPAG